MNTGKLHRSVNKENILWKERTSEEYSEDANDYQEQPQKNKNIRRENKIRENFSSLNRDVS